MSKKFEVTYKGQQITVENGWFSGEKLYVDNQLQDENIGLGFRARLRGELSGNEEVKVSIGGNFTINCRIFVDNQLIHPIQ